jgi:hypothetical protein
LARANEQANETRAKTRLPAEPAQYDEHDNRHELRSTNLAAPSRYKDLFSHQRPESTTDYADHTALFRAALEAGLWRFYF